MKKDRNGASLNEEALFGVYNSTHSGAGFVYIERYDQVIHITKKRRKHAIHGDLVAIRMIRQGDGLSKAEGEVVSVLSHGVTSFVGTIHLNKKKMKTLGYAYVLADDSRIPNYFYVNREGSMKAKDGQKVVLEITEYGNNRKKGRCEGIIKEILGYPEDPWVDLRGVALNYGFSDEFPKDAKKLAVAKDRPVTTSVIKNRLDLRDREIFTIDGDDSKDFDDAVSLEMLKGNYRLGVHIADVSEYAEEGSALDREALLRGTSLYLPGLVVPMLPEELSNGICSLNPHKTRLTLSCFMTIDKNGDVIDQLITESVIRSRHRMTYSDVNAILEDKDEKLCKKYADIVPTLKKMNTLAGILKKKRRKHGAIDFDIPQSKIVVDENGNVTDVRPGERNIATALIEEFMICANETVARTFCFKGVPFIYRSHDDPDPDRIDRLNSCVNKLGFHIRRPKGKIQPSELQSLLDKVADHPEKPLIERLTLRSLKTAKYTVEPIGHFGLASPFYCHFTSPIRRYPDLQIHRIIKDHLHGDLDAEAIEHYAGILKDVAAASSTMEKKATDAEREAEKMKKAQYMQDHIGEVFDGIISSVTEFGVYVELENTVEGMIPLKLLRDDDYICDEEGYRVYGLRTKREFVVGRPIKIRVRRADIQLREIDFLPAKK